MGGAAPILMKEDRGIAICAIIHTESCVYIPSTVIHGIRFTVDLCQLYCSIYMYIGQRAHNNDNYILI